MHFFKAKQVEKRKTNKIKLLKPFVGFNRLLELLRRRGGFSLLLCRGEGLHYHLLEVSLAPCCVQAWYEYCVNSRLYVVYDCLCPIVVHCLFTTETTKLLLGRKVSSPQ